jgi:hypothetical protein
MNETIYREADLDYIFIRTQSPDGHWGNSSLKEASDKQFLDWLTHKFGPLQNLEKIIPPGIIWTADKRVKLLNDLQERLGFSAAMIKREARDEFNKNI